MSSAVRVFCTVAFAHSLPVQIVTHHAGEGEWCLTFDDQDPTSPVLEPWDTGLVLEPCGDAGFWEFIDGKVVWANDDTMCLSLTQCPDSHSVIFCELHHGLVMRSCTEEGANWSLDSDAGAISSMGQCVEARSSAAPHGGTARYGGHARCDGSDQQRWHFRSATYYQVQSTASSLCVDVPGGDTSNGAALRMWECSDEGENQKWYLQGGQLRYLPDGGWPMSGPHGWASGKSNHKCLTLLGGGLTTNGNRLGIWDCNWDSSQQWKFDSQLGALSLASSTATEVTKCAQTAGENVGDSLVLWDCTNEPPHTRWTVPTLDFQAAFAAVV